ncbi:arsenical pump-driving ATPase [Kosakonia sp. MH5]|nr:arsenical pump-driving ATPase [Kosakonia sp. MH5]
MSEVTAFNNCMSVFWRQHEAELSRFLTSKTGDREKAADLLQELFLRARAHSDSFCEMENPRASRELPLINDVTEQFAKRIALTPLQNEEPVGAALLAKMAG